MHITDVKATRLSWGLRPKPLLSGAAGTGTGPGTNMRETFVEVFTDEGITGLGIGGLLDKVVGKVVEGPLKRQVIGEDPFDVEKIWQKMFVAWRKPVAGGEHLLYSSISGIDNAIWDIIGKVTKQPLYKLLGASRRTMTSYAAGGHYREGKTAEDLGKEMKTYVDMGFRAVKMKVGGASVEEDERRIAAARKAIGDEVILMIDANNAYPTAYMAIRMAQAAAKYRPYWFEEPCYPDDRSGWLEVKRLCNGMGIAIAGGENEFTRWGCRDLIQNRCIDIFQAAANTCGGITEWKKMAAMCSANHITVSSHGDEWTHSHLIAHAPGGDFNEVHMFRQYTYKLIPPIPLKNGYQDVLNKPGLGIDLNRVEWDSHIEGKTIPPYVPLKTEVD